MGEIGSRGIVDPKESLLAVENIARLAIELRVRTHLKPAGIVQMRAHELEGQDAYAKREEQCAQQQEQSVAVKHLPRIYLVRAGNLFSALGRKAEAFLDHVERAPLHFSVDSAEVFTENAE